ncbi:RNA polymerase sigma factor [Wenxinia marina]|uniref:RNA polymerase, sigma subunit, ECF family n=1 Tax=Wenxinia marina DSM 24838 TaxID=1123501 RepID=A0A0D0QFF6_9RHOB|nr:RNA polymerase sigma factor [Wenxinia marina]KIQ69698.1 RNA polymerase, sigma subunit, ECF family [Wenxinia marina DSM 24838]GGL60485.1 RNA polymerase sigma subunit ECF family protein [Wenxinia marina]
MSTSPTATAEATAAPFDPEGAWLVAYANGDPDAARVLTAALGPRAYAQAARMLADRAEAEDVVQEAMMRLWRIAPDWRQGEAKVSTWLYRVVANLCTDRLRRRGRGVPLDAVPEPPDDAPTAAAGMLESARHRALAAALAELPERQAQAVTLRHLEGLSNPEIAAIMDIGVEAVESLTARGKRALAAILAGRREELGWTDE